MTRRWGHTGTLSGLRTSRNAVCLIIILQLAPRRKHHCHGTCSGAEEKLVRLPAKYVEWCDLVDSGIWDFAQHRAAPARGCRGDSNASPPA